MKRFFSSTKKGSGRVHKDKCIKSKNLYKKRKLTGITARPPLNSEFLIVKRK